MGSGDVFPAEMPDPPFHLIAPLDDNTAERLLSGRLDPDDAPPAYAKVATLLRAAGAPATPDELSGQAAALAAFRTARPAPAGVGSDPTRAPDHPVGTRDRLVGTRDRLAGTRGRLFGVRGRLVTVALAGILAAGGLWIADGARLPGELGSPSGGPGAGGSGSGVSGSGVSSSGSAGLLRPAGAVAGSGAAGRVPVPPSASERATARHGGGLASRGGGSAHGSRLAKPPKRKPKPRPPKQPKLKSSGPKSSQAKPEASKAEVKAQSGKGGNLGAGGS